MAGNPARRWSWLAIVAAIVLVLWRLSPMLMPFVVAAMFAYLGDPLADRLERWHLGRTLAVSVVFIALGLVVVGVLLLVLPLLSRQVANLVQNVPHYVAWAEGTAWPWLQTRLHLDPHTFDADQVAAALKAHIGSVGGIAGQVLGTVSRSGLGVVLWLTNLVLIPVVTFYLLRDWDRLVAAVDRLLPRAIEPTVARLARDA
ncbi:MAG TPA: AI-2E family transporter, partial [Rhodanobacter sp.]|nr:AI-2E family transporter [Rhodanobacter sp.]